MANHPASPQLKIQYCRIHQRPNGVLLRKSAMRNPWQMERVFQGSFESTHSQTIGHIGRVFRAVACRGGRGERGDGPGQSGIQKQGGIQRVKLQYKNKNATTR